MVFNTKLQNKEYFQIVLTHACNRTCKFCIDYRRGDDEYLNEENLLKALAFAKKKKVKEILFIGGEPTLHPNFRKFAKHVKAYDFKLITTTNFDNPAIVEENIDLVDCWNFSYYGQKNIPKIKDVDITLSGLIYKKGFLNTKEKLDGFIDRYENDYTLKFSTLTVVNDYTLKTIDPGEWIDQLPGERFILFDFIMAQYYRDHLIKRYDIVGPDLPTLDSWKCLVDGTITRSWTG
jgi:organic radical activating enzyme